MSSVNAVELGPHILSQYASSHSSFEEKRLNGLWIVWCTEDLGIFGIVIESCSWVDCSRLSFHEFYDKGVKRHPSNPKPNSNTLYIPLHHRQLHSLPMTILRFTPSPSLSPTPSYFVTSPWHTPSFTLWHLHHKLHVCILPLFYFITVVFPHCCIFHCS